MIEWKCELHDIKENGKTKISVKLNVDSRILDHEAAELIARIKSLEAYKSYLCHKHRVSFLFEEYDDKKLINKLNEINKSKDRPDFDIVDVDRLDRFCKSIGIDEP